LMWSSRARVRAAIGGRLLQLSFCSEERHGRHVGKRGRVCGFSPGSRRRMQRRLAEISVAVDLPAFITLTLPDSVLGDRYGGTPLEYRILCERLHGWSDTWFKRLRRELPGAAGIWKMEGQRRKSGVFEGKLVPHLHLMLWGVPVESETERRCVDGEWQEETVKRMRWATGGACQLHLKYHMMQSAGSEAECDDYLKGLNFPDGKVELYEWVALSWYHVVQSGDINHLKAGTQVAVVRSQRGVASYCSKYLAKVDDEETIAMYGRCWGIHNRACIPWAQMVEIDLSGPAGYRLRRVMRHYVERSRGRRYTVRNGCGMTVYCDAESWWCRLVKDSVPDPF
jgi:hypothetical protein